MIKYNLLGLNRLNIMLYFVYMYNLKTISYFSLLIIFFTWSSVSLSQIDYENAVFECKFNKTIQIHTKKQFGMHFDKYDLNSVKFKESHDRIVWYYRNIHHLSRGLPITYKYEFFKTTKKVHLEYKYGDASRIV